MAEDIKDDSVMEAAMPPNMSIIKEEISTIEDEKKIHITPDLGPAESKEGNKGHSTSTKMTHGLLDQFPKPIIVPKIEVAVTNNTTPMLVDMLDIDTESESEDSTDDNTDNLIDKSNNLPSTIKHYDKRDSNLVSEEIDLGTNVVTKDGDVKIYGLADNLGLHLPKTELINSLGKKLNVINDSKTNTEFNVKPKNVAKKKTTATSIVYEQSVNKDSHEKYKPNKTISKIVFENKDINSNADTTYKIKNEEYFGNKIILGNRSKSKIGESSKREVKVVTEDCYSEYINSPNYCTDCNILFTTYKSFDIHYIENHLEKNETQSKDLEESSIESLTKNDNDKNVDVSDKNENIKPKKPTKETKVTNSFKNYTKGAKFFLNKFKCIICSTVISSLSNIKRHIKNVHNAQSDVDLFERVKVLNNSKSSNVKPSSNDAKIQDNSGVNKSVKKGEVRKKTSGVIAKNMSSNRYESSDSSDGNIEQSNDEYDDDDEIPLKNIAKKTNTNKEPKLSENPDSKNIADLVSKIKNNHCVHCDKTFTNKEEIINHLYDLLLPKIYTCNICQEEFVTEYNLKQHIKLHNDGVKIKIAKLSDKEMNKYLYKNSYEKRSVENDSDDGSGEYFDDDTTEIDSTKNVGRPELADNIKDGDIDDDFNTGNNIKVVKFKCKLCSATTCNSGNIHRHIRNMHHIKPKAGQFKKIIVSKNNSYSNKKLYTKAVKNLGSIAHKEPTLEASSPASDHFDDNISDGPNTFTKELDNIKEIRDTPKILSKETQSETDNHSKINLNKKLVTDKVSKSTLKSVNLSSAPVPKSVLFKCKNCDLHYISCWAARTHVNKCPGPKPAWECPDCFKTFKFSNKDMHERQHQMGEEEFVIHTMDIYNRNAIAIKVMHCCPKCGVHYSESRFTKHYNECEKDIPDSYFCLKCDMLIGKVHKDEHNKLHTSNKYDVEDFIIIEYESTDADQDDIIRIDKDETDIGNNNSPETVNPTDIDSMSVDSQSEFENKPNEVVTKTENRLARLIYCENCKTYISPFKPNNLAHFYGYCSNLLKTTCADCGLAFTCRSIFSHRNLHKRILNFSIFNLVFYNMKFEQIDPAIPELPKCSHCLLNFESFDSKINHECGEPKYKSCYYCGEDFNELSYKTHVLFHEYVNKKTIFPMNSDDILKIQSIIKKKAMGSTYNFTFYQCEECAVVLDEVDRDMHKKAKGNCLDLSHTYKKCFKCQLTILAKEFAHHSARHDRNSTFKLENFNIIPFHRTSKAESTIKMATDKKNKSWCSICKINVCESAQRHSLKHANNSIDTNKDNEVIIKPFIKRKRKFNDYETEANNKKKKTERDRKSDSDDSPSEIMDTAESSAVDDMEDHSEHKSSDNEPGKSSSKYKLKFYKKNKAHLNDPQLEVEKAQVTNSGIKENDNTASISDVTVEKIYRCLCELNFLTKAGILNHYSHCNIGSRIVKQNCTKCNLVFTPPVLFNHLVTHHSKNKEFNYEIVNLTEYASELRDEIYQCEICKAHFVVKELCEIHIENCKGENRRIIKRCTVCSLDFNIEAIALHRRKHHTAKQMNVADLDILVIKPKAKEQTDIIHNESEDTPNATTEEAPATVHLNTIDNINIDAEIVSTTRNLEQVADKIFKNIVLENYSNVIYKCERCDLHFTSSRSFKAHFDKQHAQNIIIVNCSVCLLRFSSEICLRHEYIHHKKLNLKLEDFEFITHIVKPKKEKRDEQVDMPFTLSKETKEKISRNKKLISNKIYKCSKCDVYFITPNTAFVHVRKFNHKLTRKLRKCNICNISMSAHTLERHKYIHHELNNYTFKDLKVKVDVEYCYTKTRKLFSKRKLDLNKYSNKIYKCRQCDLSHITFGALTTHVINNNHKIRTRKVKCSVCNEKFGPLGLVKHKYVHHKKFRLNKNDFEFDDEVSLKDLIEKRRDENAALEREIRGSKQTIIYRCRECNVCLLTRKTWRKHNYVHVPLLKGQKQKCDECGLNFKSNSLKRHKNVHHREKGYTLNDFWIEERAI